MDGLEGARRRSDSRTPLPPDALSTRAVLGSLLIMSGMGAVAFFLMYSSVHRAQPRSDGPAVAELPLSATPVATTIPISSTPGSSSAAIPPPAAPSPTWTATPLLTTSATRATTAAPAITRARPQRVPRVHVYPFRVFGPSTPEPSASAAQPSPVETSETSPYDQDEGSAPGTANAAPHAPRQANDVPSEDPSSNSE